MINQDEKITTISVSFKTLKILSLIKINNNFETLEDVIKYLISLKK